MAAPDSRLAPQAAPILQARLPFFLWMDPRLSRLPGILPLDPADWLHIDEAYADQMAERERLIAGRPRDVHALLPQAEEAAAELLALVLERLPALGFRQNGSRWTCPDGRVVDVANLPPLLALGRVLQEDFCLLQPGGEGEHVLTGTILCFPASWTLAEKIGRPLTGVHRPVAGYEGSLAARVQRLFDAIRPEQPLWRGNALAYADPALFQPRRERDPRRHNLVEPWLRSERQCLLRLPRTRAIVFSIHTYVVRRADLPAEARAAFDARVHPA
jgi:dimethylamine monooxygenase subunit A